MSDDESTTVVALLAIFVFPIASVVAQNSREVADESVLYKGYSGYRVSNQSLQMMYYHDQTLAIVEIGAGSILLNCEFVEVYNERQRNEAIRNLTKMVNRPYELTFKEIMQLMDECGNLDPSTPNKFINALKPSKKPSSTANDPDSHQSSLTSGILPGTVWCGKGDLARTYFDLGPEKGMDMCCRRHDLCPVKVRAHSTNYNITNKSMYTKSHCNCDREFSKCLRKSNASAASLVGNLYFNVLRIPCVEDSKKGRFFRKAMPF